MVAFAVDALLVVLTLPLFLAFGGLTVLLQTNWLEVDPSGREWAWGYVVAGLWLALPLVYFTFGSTRWRTLGARLTGLTVVRRDGARVGVRRAAMRSLLMYPSLLLLGLGFLAGGVDREGRPLHDRAAGTIVVEERSGRA